MQFQQWSIILGVNLFKTNQEVGFDFSWVRRLEPLNSSDLRFSWRFTWVSTLVRVFSQKWAHRFLAILVSIQKDFTCSSVTIFSLSFVQICLYPDFFVFKIAYDQTVARSKPKFVRSNFEILCVHVQTIVRSKPLMFKPSSGQNNLCIDFRAVKKFCVFIVRSKVSMSSLSCVYVQTSCQLCIVFDACLDILFRVMVAMNCPSSCYILD